MGLGLGAGFAPSLSWGEALATGTAEARRLRAYDVRVQAAVQAARQAQARLDTNGDEARVPGFAAMYSKGLPHDSLGFVAREAYERLAATGHAEAAPYALCLGYRMRYVLDLNAREAMHLIELRSGREGHPGYRAVAHEMHAQIAERHPAVAEAMTHVDTSAEPRLERILAEMRQEHRRAAAL